MLVEIYNVRIIGVRKAMGKDGVERIYGNIYTADGGLYPFVSDDTTISDTLEPLAYNANITWGSGKNGQWCRCELLGRI